MEKKFTHKHTYTHTLKNLRIVVKERLLFPFSFCVYYENNNCGSFLTCLCKSCVNMSRRENCPLNEAKGKKQKKER